MTIRLAPIVLAAFLVAGSSAVRAAYLLESGVAPYNRTETGFALSALFWPAHRFEVTEPSLVTSAGYFKDLDNPGEWSEVFAAIVALDGPNDLPDAIDLSGADVLATSLMIVEGEAGEYAAPFDLLLEPGWYLVAFGFGAFGADEATEGATPGPDDGWADGAPGQEMFQLRPGAGDILEQPQATTRLFVAPEPRAAALGAAIVATLSMLRRSRSIPARRAA